MITIYSGYIYLFIFSFIESRSGCCWFKHYRTTTASSWFHRSLWNHWIQHCFKESKIYFKIIFYIFLFVSFHCRCLDLYSFCCFCLLRFISRYYQIYWSTWQHWISLWYMGKKTWYCCKSVVCSRQFNDARNRCLP